jgi:tripartite-type tricarboxylate transporter receptor subunit TctC
MKSLLAVLALAAAFLSAPTAHAQSYPARPIKLIVPYGPGGTVDPTARILGARASELLGQSVVVENRAGAAGSIGTEAAVKAAADGYTVLVHTNVLASEPWLKSTLPYSFMRDMTPLVTINETPFVLLVNPALPVNSVKDLVDYAKSRPGKLNFGASGIGASGHLRGEQFQVESGVKMTYVPYRDGGTTLLGLVANDIQVSFDTLPGSIAMIREGKLKILAVSTPQRWFLVPDVPTMTEAGYPGLVSQWIGAYVRSGTPAEVLDKLVKAFQDALRDPKVKEQFTRLGFETLGHGPEQTRKRLLEETEMWRKTIAAAGIKIE